MSCPSSRSRNGLLAHEAFQLVDELRALAELEVGVEPLLDGAQPTLLEPLRLGPLAKGSYSRSARAGPRQSARAASSASRARLRSPDALASRASASSRSKRSRSSSPGSTRSEVAGRPPYDAVLPEQPAQPGDVAVERALHRGRRPLSPERLDQAVARHDLVPSQQQHRQQGALLGPAERDLGPIETSLDAGRGSRSPCDLAKQLCKAIATPLQHPQPKLARMKKASPPGPRRGRCC